MSKNGKVAVGTALAAGAGYLVGLLTAPKSGHDSRKDIRRSAQKAKAEAEQKLKTAHSELNKLVDEANEKLKSSKEKVDKEFKGALSHAESVRQKARELLSAVHEGEAEDKDLKQALDEAKLSITHLKKYIGKKAAEK